MMITTYIPFIEVNFPSLPVALENCLKGILLRLKVSRGINK
jgi:hypothetical protein